MPIELIDRTLDKGTIDRAANGQPVTLAPVSVGTITPFVEAAQEAQWAAEMAADAAAAVGATHDEQTANNINTGPLTTAALDGAIGEGAQRAAAVVNVVERGALADSGTTDNRPIIQQAIRDVHDLGGGKVIIPPAANDTDFYGCVGPLVMLSGVTLDLQGRRAHIKNTTTSIDFNPNSTVLMGTYVGEDTGGDVRAETPHYLGASAATGDRAITLTTGAGALFAAGDIIGIASGRAKTTGSPYASMLNEVISVAGDVLTLRHGLRDDYAQGTTVAGTTTATSSTIASTAHGLYVNQAVTFSAAQAPLVTGTRYYVVAKATDTYSVATTPGGVAITLTASGAVTADVKSAVYRVNLDPNLADGGPVGADGNRAFLVRNAHITGGGTISVSDWAQTQENKGQCVHPSCYESSGDYFGIGGTILAGNPISFSEFNIDGRYRYSILELGYFSNDTKVALSGQRFGPSRVSTTRCFAVYLNSEGPSDCVIDIGQITHYDAISTYSVITDNGNRNKIRARPGVINGSTGASLASVAIGSQSRGSVVEELTVPNPTQSGFYASGTAVGGEFRRCRVLKPASGYEAIVIAAGSTAVAVDCELGDPVNPTAMDVIRDDNTLPNAHRGNRVRSSLLKFHQTKLPNAHTGTTAKTSKASYTIPAGALAESGGLRISGMAAVSAGSTNGIKTASLEFGSKVLASWSFTAPQTGLFSWDITLFNRIASGVPNQQFWGYINNMAAGTITPIADLGVIDTSVAVTVNLYFTLANGADSMRRYTWVVEPIFDQVSGPTT